MPKPKTLPYSLVTSLISHMKELYRADINGITAADARNMLAAWLQENDYHAEADRLQDQVIAYLYTEEFKKLETEQQ